MNLVLDEIVYERDKGCKKCAAEPLAPLDGANRPGYRGHKIRYHENVVPIMVIGGCDIGPPTAGYGSKQTDPSEVARQRRSRVWFG
jgi:hypothetical protein